MPDMITPSANRAIRFPFWLPCAKRATVCGEYPPVPNRIQGIRHMVHRLPEAHLSAAELNLLALLSETIRTIVLRTAGTILHDPVPEEVAFVAAQFHLFPVEEKQLSAAAFIELMLLGLLQRNPAAKSFLDPLGVRELDTLHPSVEMILRRAGSIGGEPLFDQLLQVILRHPESLSAQVRALAEGWRDLLPPELLEAIPQGEALLAEERQIRGGWGPPPVPGPGWFGEGDAYSDDREWMIDLIMLTKSVLVWMVQLSRFYGRTIERLDQIPDEELDCIASRGITGLWLVGIWERSGASRTLKRLRGNPEAEPSAYAVHDYVVAERLGGEEAMANLQWRARMRGIRIACDMVPNHCGLSSRWLTEHPDWFIQSDYPPFPGYRFTRHNLAQHPELDTRIDDGYYDHSEAAVVFRHQEVRSGRVRYIYHGNDGTHLPWNDTAQLDFLQDRVRRAVADTVVGIAKRYPIIRFDAAMTLTRKHFQRLWYPRPGGGAGVPGRTEHAFSQEEFDRLFPVEFWREVVDRVQTEAPDTLLLAEAFWLLESFFVRTLGMHRVYNSAFMHMLRQEENARYRKILQEALAESPPVLQRFVNFLSNPDEESCAVQFGTGDKYFGILSMMLTLPGLPMLAHGQIEGYREKYGMEYARPYWGEEVDQPFVAHQERTVFPLMRRRKVFSRIEHFQLFRAFDGEEEQDEVIAYSNRSAEGRGLFILNNTPVQRSLLLGLSVARASGHGSPGEIDLAAALGLTESGMVRMRDLADGAEYLRTTEEMRTGLPMHLAPYGYHLFVDIVPLDDPDGSWLRLCKELQGRPVADLARARRERELVPLRHQVRETARLILQGGAWMDTLPRQRELLLTCGFSDCDLKEIPSDTSRLHTLFAFLDRLASLRVEPLLEGLFGEELPDILAELDSRIGIEEWRALIADGVSLIAASLQAPAEDRIPLLLALLACRATGRMVSQGANPAITAVLRELFDLSPANVEQDVSGYADLLFQLANRTEDSRQVVFVASEAAPYVKSGGLADVIGALPGALREGGADVRVLIPWYPEDQLAEQAVETGIRVHVPLDSRTLTARLLLYPESNPPVYAVAGHPFDRRGLYGTPLGDFPDNLDRFTFFCRAVLLLLPRMGLAPDVIHVHDWQTGLIPFLLRHEEPGNPYYDRIGSCMTIHNLAYQGRFPHYQGESLRLPLTGQALEKIEFFGDISLLKGGIVAADRVTTVSPTYSREIRTPGQGREFDGILRALGDRLSGIVNGLDRLSYDPAGDRALPVRFSFEDPEGKASCKEALQREFGLRVDSDTPLLVMVTRLDPQKGIELLQGIWLHLLGLPVQFILLGTGGEEYMRWFGRHEQDRPGEIAIHLGFDEALSRRVFAGSDLFLMPSIFEPCGLAQMIAMRYGTIPVVRRTGGLADTVIDADRYPQEGNGIVFDSATPEEFLAAIRRGIAAFTDKTRWRILRQRAMAADFAWQGSAEAYRRLYDEIFLEYSA